MYAPPVDAPRPVAAMSSSPKSPVGTLRHSLRRCPASPSRLPTGSPPRQPAGLTPTAVLYSHPQSNCAARGAPMSPHDQNQLASYAMDVRSTLGRRYPEPPHAYRSEYERDRDRIIHSRAFRRLENKTQVFTRRYSDHFRNRLTHTLEVAQISRTVGQALGLNTELAEALALVHDIGHPPFGHAGEAKLNELMREQGGCFNHNLHALRIVEQFEQRYLDFPGLNLTFEVREGIIKHSHDYSAAEVPQLAEYLLDLRPPLEAQLIDWVDEIAYNTADFDDALEAELLDLATFREEVLFFGELYAQVDSAHRGAREKLIFNEALKRVLDALATDLIESTQQRVLATGASSVESIRRAPIRLTGVSDAGAAQNRDLKRFLF